MSYMNPDTDPFGIPYSTMSCTSNEEDKKYSFEDLTNLHEKQRKIENELFDIKTEKKEVIAYLTEKLKNYADVYAKMIMIL